MKADLSDLSLERLLKEEKRLKKLRDEVTSDLYDLTKEIFRREVGAKHEERNGHDG